jgi:NAD(P)-dependent dehydrogenase (short-subunit alcohol dehydrogenase family)
LATPDKEGVNTVDRRAVVTGGASGIGLAVVRRLLQDGTAVVAVDRNQEGLATARKLGAQPEGVDVTDAADRKRLVESAGEIDYLVNAAGIIKVSAIEAVEPRHWRDQFAVNAEAIFFVTQAFMPLLRGGGAIVNVSSMAAKTSEVDAAVYSATKAAVISLTRSFAAALADRGIRVNAVAPGIVDTPMQDTFLPYYAQRAGQSIDVFQNDRVAKVPLKRIGKPEDVANVIHFLLSDDASYMTGQVVNVTGGLVTW